MTNEIEYNNWNLVKIGIEKQNRQYYVKEREVVWIHLGKNVGDEENGKGYKFQRPVLVLKVFNANIFYGIPLSTKIKPNNKYYLNINLHTKDVNDLPIVELRSIILSHARLFDTKRVNDRLGYIEKEDFVKSKNAFKALF